MSLAATVFATARPTRPSRPSTAVIVALVTAAVLGPSGVVIVRERDLNPLSSAGVAAPVAYAFLLGVVLVVVGLLAPRAWAVGITVGGVAAWASAAVAAPLVGTPYGYGALSGDAGRMSALATYFATTMRPSDAADPALPPEYPPLYPMVTGRIAAVTGKAAWLLLGPMQMLLVGLSVLAAFWAWQRLVPLALAVPLSLAPWAGLAEPSKGNEILALSVFLPLLLATFTSTPVRRPLHPLLAGVIFGVMVPLYPNFLILGLVGIAMMIVRGFLVAPDRATYAAHAAIVVVVAAVVSAWYLGPLIASYLGGHSEVVADLFRSGALTEAQFLLFRSKSAFIGTLQALGVVGILVFWRACWWAAPLGLLAAGILVTKAVMLLRYTFPPGHSFMLLYTPYVLGYLFAAAGLLTLGDVVRRAWPWVVAHTGTSSRIGAVVGVAALCAVFAAPTYMVAWAVRPLGVADTYGVDRNAAPESTAALAHAEYLPNLDRPRYPWRKMATGFPTTAVDTAIRMTSATPEPVVLSGDQRLFAFHWYPNWLPPSRTSSNALTQWDSRFAWLKKASRTTDSAALASALGNTPYGPIDVLVLQRTDKGYQAGHITFAESALTGPGFIATEGLPLGWAVFVRR